MPDEDVSAPWRRGGWEYRTRRPAGAQYPVHVRRAAGHRPGRGRRACCWTRTPSPPGHDFLELGVCEPSPDGALLAYSVDHDGDEVYTLRVRDLAHRRGPPRRR